MSIRTIDITEATQPLADYAQQANDGTVVVTSRGEPIAAVVPVGDADWESVSLSLNPEFIEIIERSRARHAKEGGISSAEVRRRFGDNAAKPQSDVD
jgi:prevent-host-death family protein